MKLLTALLNSAAVANTTELFFKPEKFVEMLSYMGIGMLVIFVVIGIIILVTALINKIFSGKKTEA